MTEPGLAAGAAPAVVAAGAPATGPPQSQIVIVPRDQKDGPLRKLTTGLLATYKLINHRYYEMKKLKAKQGVAKEDYQVTVGDVLGGRYKVEESMGKGSFGQVVSCTDQRTGNKVAVKVIKNKEAFRRQARTEVRLLELLNKKDPDDQWCIVRFHEQFDHGGHTCLVFEHLSFNLYELLKRTHFRGVSLTLIRKFARQILKALAYLALPEINVIHCDLKPENLLFRVPNRSAIKVIDFGSSCSADKRMYKYIQSRFYRSPEVILELAYAQPIDMWSLGCILAEMHTGIPLFAGRDEADQLRRFVALKGLPPPHMLASCKKGELFFEAHRGDVLDHLGACGGLAASASDAAAAAEAAAAAAAAADESMGDPAAAAAAEGATAEAGSGSGSSGTAAAAPKPPAESAVAAALGTGVAPSVVCYGCGDGDAAAASAAAASCAAAGAPMPSSACRAAAALGGCASPAAARLHCGRGRGGCVHAVAAALLSGRALGGPPLGASASDADAHGEWDESKAHDGSAAAGAGVIAVAGKTAAAGPSAARAAAISAALAAPGAAASDPYARYVPLLAPGSPAAVTCACCGVPLPPEGVATPALLAVVAAPGLGSRTNNLRPAPTAMLTPTPAAAAGSSGSASVSASASASTSGFAPQLSSLSPPGVYRLCCCCYGGCGCAPALLAGIVGEGPASLLLRAKRLGGRLMDPCDAPAPGAAEAAAGAAAFAPGAGSGAGTGSGTGSASASSSSVLSRLFDGNFVPSALSYKLPPGSPAPHPGPSSAPAVNAVLANVHVAGSVPGELDWVDGDDGVCEAAAGGRDAALALPIGTSSLVSGHMAAAALALIGPGAGTGSSAALASGCLLGYIDATLAGGASAAAQDAHEAARLRAAGSEGATIAAVPPVPRNLAAAALAASVSSAAAAAVSAGTGAEAAPTPSFPQLLPAPQSRRWHAYRYLRALLLLRARKAVDALAAGREAVRAGGRPWIAAAPLPPPNPHGIGAASLTLPPAAAAATASTAGGPSAPGGDAEAAPPAAIAMSGSSSASAPLSAVAGVPAAPTAAAVGSAGLGGVGVSAPGASIAAPGATAASAASAAGSSDSAAAGSGSGVGVGVKRPRAVSSASTVAASAAGAAAAGAGIGIGILGGPMGSSDASGAAASWGSSCFHPSSGAFTRVTYRLRHTLRSGVPGAYPAPPLPPYATAPVSMYGARAAQAPPMPPPPAAIGGTGSGTAVVAAAEKKEGASAAAAVAAGASAAAAAGAGSTSGTGSAAEGKASEGKAAEGGAGKDESKDSKDKGGDKDKDAGGSSSKKHREPPIFGDIREVIGVHTGGPQGRRKHEKSGHSEASYRQFLHLLERMLEWDPATRIKPLAALNHPFLREDIAPEAAGGGGGSGAAPSAAGGAGGAASSTSAASAGGAGAGAGGAGGADHHSAAPGGSGSVSGLASGMASATISSAGHGHGHGHTGAGTGGGGSSMLSDSVPPGASAASAGSASVEALASAVARTGIAPGSQPR